MSAAASRAAGSVAKAGQAVAKSASRANAAANEAATKKGKDGVFNKEAKRNPELYVLLTVMTGAFGMAGYYFGSKPTTSASEAPVSMAEGSMPWQTTSKSGGPDEQFKYQYHPGGDKSKAVKDAPSALHSTIIPNMTLPKKVHDRVNKWGRDDY